MQTAPQKEILQKTGLSHPKRYSDADFRTNKLDKLLLTQTSLLSQPKIRFIRTKLPLLSTCNVTTASQTAFHSHAKVGKLAQNATELQEELSNLNQGLQELKHGFAKQKDNLNDKLNHTHQALRNKVVRLQNMVEFSLRECGDRSNSLMEDCHRLKQTSDIICSKISLLREKMRHLENSLGVYTGQDKYLA